ncbi:ROK family protein [Intestinibacillus sp. Marseille-P6563]|uniref:ROK family protein n=1 Tax=Intestinibacillus sp. Marseille-P6563 TaxID=2364792 RepID=UPI000F0584AE|nr:ROK family protein [Intestinibacillus sp. Marseille-P6563]
MKKYISIDIGGTAIKYGIIGEDATVFSRDETPTRAEQGGPAILQRVIDLTEALLQTTPASGICISTAGMVDPVRGEIFYAAPLIPNYAGTCFKQVLETKFGLPCEVENDVNCAGLAEYRSGAAQGSRSMVMLTIGTGIGGCAVLDGHILHGAGNSACEIGYLRMRGSDFQTLGAASVLSARVAERKGDPAEAWDGRRIFAGAQAGDAVCQEEIDNMVDVLGEGIANLCYVLDPEIVVLGGGIMAQEAYLRGRLETAIRRYLIDSIASHVRLAFAAHRNDAGMLGAFYHFISRHPV